MNIVTTPGRRPARSLLAVAVGVAAPVFSLTVLAGGPAAADRGAPAPPAPPVAVTASQTQPGDHRPPAPPAEPPAEQARVPSQLPAAPAAPPATGGSTGSAATAGAATGSGAGSGTAAGSAQVAAPQADTTAGERVVVCKYVRKPHVAEVASHVIIVNEQALLGRGFTGTFPWAFSDAQFYSVAIRWAQAGERAHQVSLASCPRAPGGGGGDQPGGGSAGGNDIVAPTVPLSKAFGSDRTVTAPVHTAAGELPQTGAPSGLEQLLLLSSAALVAGVALRVRARRSQG